MLNPHCLLCLVYHKFSINLYSSIFVFHKSIFLYFCFFHKYIFLHLFSINLYSSIFVFFQTSSRGEGQNNNCEHAWQQQGEFSPPCYVWMDDSVIFLFWSVAKKQTAKRDYCKKDLPLLCWWNHPWQAVEECFSFLAPALPHAVSLLTDKKKAVNCSSHSNRP